MERGLGPPSYPMENLRNLCNLVHFGSEIRKMYNAVLNLDYERSI